MDNSTVTIEIERYEELLHKEKHLEIILNGLARLSGYTDVTKFKEFLGIEEEEQQ